MNNTNTTGEALDLNKSRAEFEAWWGDYADPNVGSVEYMTKRQAAIAGWQAAKGLDADELVRLRRLVDALGMDGSAERSDGKVRGLLFVALGRAADKIESAALARRSLSVDAAGVKTWQERMTDAAFDRVRDRECTASETAMLAEIADLRTALARAGSEAPAIAAPAATAEPIGEVMGKPDNEHGTLSWPRVVWKDGLFALPPVGTKLYAAAPTAPVSAAPTLTAQQIAAGAAVLGDDGKPIGRNTAIMVADAMGVGAAPTGQPDCQKGAPCKLAAPCGECPYAAPTLDPEMSADELAETSAAPTGQQAEPVALTFDHYSSDGHGGSVLDPQGRFYLASEVDAALTAPVSAAPAAPTEQGLRQLIEARIKNCAATIEKAKPDWDEGLAFTDGIMRVLQEILAAAPAAEGSSEPDAKVPGIAYQTTYADLARLTPEQLWNRWRPSGSPPDAKTAFIAARSIPFAVPLPTKEGAGEVDAKLANRVRDLIADHLADNWPTVRYHLEEVEKKVRAINADYLLQQADRAAMSAAQAQPKDTTDTWRDA